MTAATIAVAGTPPVDLASTFLRRVPRQQRSRDRLDSMLDGAAHLLATVGPSGTTITAVARSVGLPATSIYDYVESERELIAAVAARGLDRIHEVLATEIGTPASVDELQTSLAAALRLFLDRYQHDPGLNEALAFIDADPQLAEVNLADTRRNAALIAAHVERLTFRRDTATIMLLLTHLSGSLASLAARVDAAEADDLVAAFEQLLALALS